MKAKASSGSQLLGEYKERGEYHRNLDKGWAFYHIYKRKMDIVERFLDSLPAMSSVLDAGCGEGLLVEKFSGRLSMKGIDENYSSSLVSKGSITSLPFKAGSFDAVLVLDVLEHLAYSAQEKAVQEAWRVLKKGGKLVVSVPNLAHMLSRLKFLFKGEFIRTSNIRKHIGDRPLKEYARLVESSGFSIERVIGIPDPKRSMGLHPMLGRFPGMCLEGVIMATKRPSLTNR